MGKTRNRNLLESQRPVLFVNALMFYSLTLTREIYGPSRHPWRISHSLYYSEKDLAIDSILLSALNLEEQKYR